MDERGIWKPNVEISPNCPRCGCSNTKFCYYNNYSLSQPRYFCKGCRRYWTKGGSLRNVPIGGGCRKNRRAKSLRLLSSSTTTTLNLDHRYNHHDQIHNAHQAKISSTSSTNLGNYELFSTNNIINPIGNNNFLADHYSTVMPNGSQNSHIDLALVYANFLNQKPSNDNNGNGSQYDPSLELLSLKGHVNNLHQLPQENIGVLFGCQSSTSLNSDHHLQQNTFFCGLDDHDDQNRVVDHDQIDGLDDFAGLPPLPGHEIANSNHNYDEEVLWSNNSNHNNLMVSPDPNSMQITTHDQVLLGLNSDHAHDQDRNLLTTGNWSPFDFLSDHDDTFSVSTRES